MGAAEAAMLFALIVAPTKGLESKGHVARAFRLRSLRELRSTRTE
jgi:hypothetical protein